MQDTRREENPLLRLEDWPPDARKAIEILAAAFARFLIGSRSPEVKGEK